MLPRSPRHRRRAATRPVPAALRALAAWALLAVAHAGPSAAVEDHAARAKALYQDGVAAYDRRQYAQALHAFSLAFDFAPRPALLFNIAACHTHLGRYADAASSLRRYVAAWPDAPDRAETERRIDQLDLATQSTSAVTRATLDLVPRAGGKDSFATSTAATAPPATASTPRAAIALLGIAGVLGAGGAAAGAAALGTADPSCLSAGAGCGGYDAARYSSVALLGGSAAAALAGALTWVLTARGGGNGAGRR